MSCLKKVKYYKSETKDFYMMTGFNTCTNQYQCIFPSGFTNSIKTKKLHERNVNHFIEQEKFIEIYYKPKCF